MSSGSKSTLSKEEKKISTDLARGRYRTLGLAQRETYVRAARHDVKRRKSERKEERINIRLTTGQLTRLKERAEYEGLPYQSLIASILQKYLNGALIDVNQIATVRRLLRDAL